MHNLQLIKAAKIAVWVSVYSRRRVVWPIAPLTINMIAAMTMVR